MEFDPLPILLYHIFLWFVAAWQLPRERGVAVDGTHTHPFPDPHDREQ